MPSCAGPAVELAADWVRTGRVPPARTVLAPAPYPREPPAPADDAPFALVQDGGRFLLFEAPLAELVARDAAGVRAALGEADAALAAGRFVAGFLAYEAAAAFGFATRPPDPDGPPLVWLGVFEAPREAEPPRAEPGGPVPPARWEPALDAAGHAGALARIHERLAAGDTYQVNFTFPLRAPLRPRTRFALFARLVAAQRPRHAALVDLGRFAVASASPELFFRLEDGPLTTRPMKGTAAAGRPRRRTTRRSRRGSARRRRSGPRT